MVPIAGRVGSLSPSSIRLTQQEVDLEQHRQQRVERLTR